MADEALNMFHNGSGLRMDVFKCINVLLGADGYGLADRFARRGVYWRESSLLCMLVLSLVTGAE